jgi:hypothetical protein
LEAADRHFEGFDFAILVDEHVTDLADLGVGWIIALTDLTDLWKSSDSGRLALP